MNVNQFVSQFLNWMLVAVGIWFVLTFAVPLTWVFWLIVAGFAFAWLCRHKPYWAVFFLGFFRGLLGGGRRRRW